MLAISPAHPHQSHAERRRVRAAVEASLPPPNSWIRNGQETAGASVVGSVFIGVPMKTLVAILLLSAATLAQQPATPPPPATAAAPSLVLPADKQASAEDIARMFTAL